MLRAIVLIFLALCCFASEYADRRERLRQANPDALIVLWGLEEHERSGFFQEPNFYYLTGSRQPGAMLLLCQACPTKEVFFMPKRNARKELYDGPPELPVGFAEVSSEEKLEQHILKSLEHAKDVMTLFDGHESALRQMVPLRPVKDVRAAMTLLRLRKSDGELALLRKAIDASIAAHFESWRVTKAGLYEYQVAAAMQKTYFDHGCERNAYPPIVGSGPNSVILHYNQNKRRMDSGEVLLMDVGGECNMYAADITRTIPVDGKWTARQKQVYDLVLGAQKAVIAAAKPGVMLKDLTQVARNWFNAQGKGPEGKPWGDYLLHGVSHHIGLDVHDPHDPALPLEEGNVITVEPGLYIAAEKLGIRIEDMIVITRDGAKLLTDALPKDAAEIERRMKR